MTAHGIGPGSSAKAPVHTTLRDQIDHAVTARIGPTEAAARLTDDLSAIVTPFITDLHVVSLDAPCVECGEPFEAGDRVSWRLRWSPQGLIHEECR